MLRQQRKFAIVIIFIVAAILTPPDVFSQCLMAAPLLVLYEISVIVARVFGRKNEPGQAREAKDAV
jgi:sec-independent protein translocase protein TatC